MEDLLQISVFGTERLVREIFRQAIYDWGKAEYRPDVCEFLCSPWAGELAELFGVKPQAALERLECGEIHPQEFHADYCSGGDPWS